MIMKNLFLCVDIAEGKSYSSIQIFEKNDKGDFVLKDTNILTSLNDNE